MQNVLVCRATGERAEQFDYDEARTAVLVDPSLAARVPRFVHSCRDLSQFWGYIKQLFPQYQQRRDHIWSELRPAFEYLEAGARNPATTQASDILLVVDAPHVVLAWQAAFMRKDSDPEGAITIARTLLESVCKHILDKAAISYDDTWDLPKLYGNASEQLNLAPQQHSELVFKQILGGCRSVVEGLGALRNKHGDAHGKGIKHVRPSARHASLAVHLAGGVASFLIETFEERGIRKP
jgi:hypothetical protein